MSKETFVCDCIAIHEEAVRDAVRHMPEEGRFDGLIAFYKLIGDRTRCRILFLLDRHEMCVCDIAFALGLSKSLVSHQLRLLREGHVVSCRRRGKEVFYTLCDEHIRVIFEAGLEHAGEETEEI